MSDNPPDWLEEWSRQIGAELKDGLRENPSWIAFARENGTVYHTYTVSAPDPFVAPYYKPKANPPNLAHGARTPCGTIRIWNRRHRAGSGQGRFRRAS
jgi:hypothetical protein